MDEIAVTRITEHYSTFQDVLDLAYSEFAKGQVDTAAAYCQVAAKFAASRHPGMFASRRLEQLLTDISACCGAQGRISAHSRWSIPGTPQRVLHVFTQVASVGGHTRMLWRWIGRDGARTHSVAITRQGPEPIPPELNDAVQRNGGQVHLLDRRGGLLSRAKRLKTIASASDLTVLHVDPDDVVPSIAFGHNDDRPVVAYLNHADQFFWAGVHVTDVLVNLRHSGALLSQARRGISLPQSSILPIPLSERPNVNLTKEAARQIIGVPRDAIVLLSIARPHKFAHVSGDTFLDSILPIVEQHSDVYVVVVGRAEDHVWESARHSSGGRIRALGLRRDTEPFYAAADVYVDSYPVVSITSLLEAGSFGLPLVSRHPDGSGDTILAADTPALRKCLIGAGDSEELRQELDRLIAYPRYRLSAGNLARRSIHDVHQGNGWNDWLTAFYHRVESVDLSQRCAAPEDACSTTPVDLRLPELFPREPDLEQILRFTIRHMPGRERLEAWARLCQRERRLYPGLVLSHSQASQLERLTRSVRIRVLDHGIRRSM